MRIRYSALSFNLVSLPEAIVHTPLIEGRWERERSYVLVSPSSLTHQLISIFFVLLPFFFNREASRIRKDPDCNQSKERENWKTPSANCQTSYAQKKSRTNGTLDGNQTREYLLIWSLDSLTSYHFENQLQWAQLTRLAVRGWCEFSSVTVVQRISIECRKWNQSNQNSQSEQSNHNSQSEQKDNNSRNQLEYKVNTSKLPEARENAGNKFAFGFGS